MTEVIFHVNAPDRLLYTCRLLRKALHTGANVAVTGSGQTLAELDKLLWTFDDEAFLPHAVVNASSSRTPGQSRAPLKLTEDVRCLSEQSWLVNLRDDLVPGFESFARLFEIVPADDVGRSAGRARWRAYLDGGYTPTKHEVAS